MKICSPYGAPMALSLGRGHVCLPRNACRRGLTGTPPSEATFRCEADCTRGCVAGRKWRPEEARRVSEMAAEGEAGSRRPCGFALPHGHLLQDPPPASPFHHSHPGLLGAPLPVHHAPSRAVGLASKSGLGRGGTRETPPASIALRAKPLLPQREGGNTTSSVGQPFKAF